MALPKRFKFSNNDDEEFPNLRVVFDNGKTFCYCDICYELKRLHPLKDCIHWFCQDCITKLISTNLENNVAIIPCPGLNCKRRTIQLESVRSLLPKSLVDLWSAALCKNFLNESQTLYCPFRDCNATLLIDNCNEIVRLSECPSCHRLFCAYCNIPWHSGIDCKEHGRLNEDDMMVIELAKKNKWSRCPRCKFYVERTEGCPHITCRCKYQFCYGCGEEWNKNHYGCASG
ncbi:hypothetical protein ACFE04_007706 [Oxalis oulophora]